MPRIDPAGPEQYEPLFGPEATPSQRIHAHRPELAQLYGALIVEIREGDSRELPARLGELVRLRIAFHNQCRSCMAVRYPTAAADGVTEDLVCSLEKPYEAPDLTDADRAALAYADRMATDHPSVDDATYDDLRKHFSESQIVELGFLCAVCVGFGRLAATWNMVEELPERFRERDGLITPWEPAAS